MSQNLTNLKHRYVEVSDQLSVLRLASRHQQFDPKSKTALENDIKVASQDLEVLNELIKRASLDEELARIQSVELDVPSLDKSLQASEVDPLFHVPSREERFATNKSRLDKLTDKIADAQLRVEDFEYKHGKNRKTSAYRGKLAGIMRKLADATEQLDLADEVAEKSLEEVEQEVSDLNEEEQSGGPYSYESTGDDLEHHIAE